MPQDDVRICEHCGGTGEVRTPPPPAGDARTVAEVMAQRARPGSGCCDRHCDNMGCNCLILAQQRELKRIVPALSIEESLVCGVCNGHGALRGSVSGVEYRCVTCDGTGEGRDKFRPN